MRTFIIKARKGTTSPSKIRSTIGSKEHFEVVAHSVINTFFVSSDFRENVEIYIVLDSSEDFPRTIKLASKLTIKMPGESSGTETEGISLSGFHEEAVLELIERALIEGRGLRKDETRRIAPGLEISGFGFEKLVQGLLKTRSVYLLDRKGVDIRSAEFVSALEKDPHPVFVLSDHLAMPKKSIKGLERQGLESLSLGKKMLFASQCVVILHYELDRLGVAG
jgi:tRNA (pseudouridine54-N1)-methyltransferase